MISTIKNCKAVTLVELVAILVILGIIASIGFFTIGNVIQNARQKADVAELANINYAMELMFVSVDEGTFEALETVEDKLNYLVDEDYLSTYPEAGLDTNSYLYDETLNVWYINGEGDTVTYTETGEEYFTVSGTKITSYDIGGGTSIVIPQEIDGVTITEIGQDCFRDEGITSVVIQEGINRISGNSFHTNSLTTVIIPDSVTRIWHNAFNNNSLTSVEIGSGVTRIEAGAFSSNSFTTITLPSNVTYVGAGAFGYGSNFITTITLGANVTIENSSSMGKYGSGFKTLYDVSKEAGTYTYNAGTWTKN